MKKRLLILVAVFAYLCNTYATAGFTTLQIWQRDGGKTDVQLMNEPRVKISNDSLFVTSSLSRVALPLSNVLRFTYFNKGASNVIDITNGSKVPYTQHGDVLSFTGQKQGAQVLLLSSDGKLMAKYNCDDNGALSLSLGSLPPGVYLINTPVGTCKFVKRLNSADCLLAYFKSMLRSYFSQYFSYKTFFLPASYLIVHYQVQNPPPK